MKKHLGLFLFVLVSNIVYGEDIGMVPPAFGNSVQEYYLEAFRLNREKRSARLNALKTPEEAKLYISDIRKRIRSLFQFPSSKSPLNAEITGKIELPYCTVEKVLFQSRKNFSVTGNLFLPKSIPADGCPVVLILSGHASEGKVYYQPIAKELVSHGIAAFMIDAIGQGERHQFRNVPGFPDIEPDPCLEHNILGKQLLLVGEWFGSWRTYDAIRAIDYLLTRPEIDASRIGVTGNSGGGTLTSYLAALDDRISASAPGFYITTWERNIANELPADIEQTPPGAISAGLEMADFLLATAPHPCIVLSARNDFFDMRGALKSFEELRKIHTILGSADNVVFRSSSGDHAFSRYLMEECCKFFVRIFHVSEPSKVVFVDEEIAQAQLNATPNGEVSELSEEQLVRDFVRQRVIKTKTNREIMSKEAVCRKLTELLRLKTNETPDYRVLRPRSCKLRETVMRQSRFGLETESNHVMAVLSLFSDSSYYHLPEGERATLYVAHLDSVQELLSHPIPENSQLWGLDVRGTGECRPAQCEPFSVKRYFSYYGYDYHYASLALMNGQPYMAGKVRDILGAVDLLAAQVPEITLEARGQACIPVLIAAILSDRITRVRLIDCPESWESIAVTPWPAEEKYPLSIVIPGVLSFFDIPDLKKVIADKILQ